MTTASDLSGQAATPPLARGIAVTQPFTWISKGWDDLLHHKGASLAYGALVCVLGALILTIGRHPYLMAAAISGFLLVGPIMATGLCELSRLRTRGEVSNFDNSLKTLTRHRTSLLHYALALLLFSIAWFVLSSLMLYLAFGSVGPSYFETMWGDLLVNLTTAQIVSYLGLGGLLACIVFALSVVTVPMIIDRDADPGTAMRTSLSVVRGTDLPVMLVWSALCVLLVGIGFLTFLIGMVVVFPLLGHATWHAYLDLVPQAEPAPRPPAPADG